MDSIKKGSIRAETNISGTLAEMGKFYIQREREEMFTGQKSPNHTIIVSKHIVMNR